MILGDGVGFEPEGLFRRMTLGDRVGFEPEGLFRRMTLGDGAGFTPEEVAPSAIHELGREGHRHGDIPV
jgi:hypothetical protein